MLRWVAEHYFTGQGAICELGTFVGGSTARLAYGLTKNRTATTKIQCFDRYECAERHKQQLLYDHGIAAFTGEDILPLARDLLAEFTGLVEFHKCDILDTRWDGGAIEILFIDIAKTRKTNDHVLETFFSSLIEGESLVIQQDYFHHSNPWVVAQLESLKDCFELVAFTQNNSAIFRYKHAPSTAQLEKAKTAEMTDKELITHLYSAMARFPLYRHKQHLARSILTVRKNPGVLSSWEYGETQFSFEELDSAIEKQFP